MSYTLQIPQTINNTLPCLSLTQQPYLSSTQTLLIVPSTNNQIIYHGYKHKDKEQHKAQSTNQKAAQQAKPKKKFNFKVTKNTQTKPTQETTQKVSIFSNQQNKWQSIQLKGKPPLPRENHYLISMNSNTVIMYGGKSLQNQKLLNDLHVLNTQTLLWKKLFSIECPSISQSNIIIKLTDTKIMLLNFKQVWTFQSKDVKWQLNTNELPGGLWENLQIKIDSVLNPQRQFLLNGLTLVKNDDYSTTQYVVFFTVDKNSQHINSYMIDLSNKEINKIKLEKDIFVDDLQNTRNLVTCNVVQQEASDMILLSVKKKDIIEINLLKMDFKSFCFKNATTKQVQLKDLNTGNLNGLCFDQSNKNLYFLTTSKTNTKQKYLQSISVNIQKTPQQQFSLSEKKTKNQISGYLSSSQIHSIPQESNQSSLIGIKNHQNQRYQQFQDQQPQQNQPYNHHHYSMINSQRQKQSTSRPSSEVNRSPSVISHKQKSQISDDDYKLINEVTKHQQHNDHYQHHHKSRFDNNSNIYLSPGSQLHNKSNIQMQNNNSSFPQQQYLQSTLQKILVFQHLKRQKLQEKTQFLEKSIKNSQNLAKLLTKFATPHQKNHHIDQVKYLKQQLQNIWNKQIFFRKQIHQHFVNSQNESSLRNSTQNERHSRDMQRQKNKGKIDMRKLLQKHNLLQQE